MHKVIAVVDKDKCRPEKCSQECISYDPLNRSGGEGFHIGESGKAEIGEAVVGEMHKISAKMCPFAAIKIVKLPEALDKQPIHSYGDNAFRLFSLPTPLFGKVVGILGRNGIGKSTAIKVLAGILKPNLGGTEEASYDDLIAYFKGTEAQIYFEKLKKGEITVSYKPQQVELIPKTQTGSVKDLLTKVDEKDALVDIASTLGIDHILDNDITKISGGELQRVAIAATVLKKANLYIFDEPTSYLDSKQRIKVSTFIRGLADDKTAVLVVEHDLIILDYMTDMVHMMYGNEGAYGIVSQPRTTKVGINVYLSGYLKEENIRFRDKAIKFTPPPPETMRTKIPLTSWEGLQKKAGNFVLKAHRGTVYQNEVVGVLGENGIGKTTFVRLLAGVTQLDEGEVKQKVTVSYKPQYLDAESEDVVATYLQEAMQYKNQIISPLQIEGLLMKKLNQLSGGELQRVSIAACLAREAELYLFDEPSAYLDVEQRLTISKVIKEFMDVKGTAAIVVDHDLLFIDYIADNILVFEGQPAVTGSVEGPFAMEQGMNQFLSGIDISFRRDHESRMPRANKPGSVKDREQKAAGKLYYI